MKESSREGGKNDLNKLIWLFHLRASPKGTLVFLEGFMDEHVSLHFVLPVERRFTEGTFVWLFTWKMESASNSHL